MRFLNTSTLQFEEVADSTLDMEENRYAILSHRWGMVEDEISFADIQESKAISHKKGFAKLKGFCDRASCAGLRYGWDDTCCINKKDSSELSEAINSMYRWYAGSSTCIIYLEDVPEKRLMDSSWFDRGWTLQELIGPQSATFYDRDWHVLGTKSQLLGDLSAKTRVPQDVLSHDKSPATCSIAQRMSWAAKRQTTRIEDRAYSLLGIFGVSIPQIYGERAKAFLRLQRAIIQQSKDESIFAWSMDTEDGRQPFSGLLAPSPSSFHDCSDVISLRGSTGFVEANGELSITLGTFPHSMETFYATLNCTQQTSPDYKVTILLTRLSSEYEYVRTNMSFPGSRTLLKPIEPRGLTKRSIRVALEPTERPPNRAYGFWLRTLNPPAYMECRAKLLSRDENVPEDEVCLNENQKGTAGIIYLEPNVVPEKFYLHESGWSKIRWIKLGFDDDFNPMILLANNSGTFVVAGRGLAPVNSSRILFSKAMASEPGSQARKEIFNNDWITAKAYNPGRSHGWRGASILRVDRRHGLSGSLQALNLGISIRRTDREEGATSKQIWVVDITDTGGSDPERDLARFDHAIIKEELKNVFATLFLSACLLCCFSPLNSTDAIKHQRETDLNRTKVLEAIDL